MGMVDSFPQPSPTNCRSAHKIHRPSTADSPLAHTLQKAQPTDGGRDIHNLVQHYYYYLYSKKKNAKMTVHREVLHNPSSKTPDREAHERER